MKKEETKKIILVSLNGIGNSGGVERVCFYLKEILSAKYDVRILERPRISFGKLNVLLFPLINSIKLLFSRNVFVISNSWQLYAYPSDISIHHGTTQGCINNIAGFDCFSARVIAMLERMSAKRAKHVLSVSRNCTDELIRLYGIRSQKIATLNNFVDGSLFFPLPQKEERSDCVICFSGRICLRKGMDALLELSEYLETISGVKLLIACNDDANTSAFAGKVNTQIKTGLDIADMNDFYNEGDIFYFPTLYEGFSMSTLEALSCGLPVIGSCFAVPKELDAYEFCKRAEGLSAKEVVENALRLHETFKGRREEIHEIINRDFGKKQYSEELFEIIYGFEHQSQGGEE